MTTLILAEKNSIAKSIIEALQLTTKNKITAKSASVFFTTDTNKKSVIVCSSGGHIAGTKFPPFDKIKIENIPILEKSDYFVDSEKSKIVSVLKKEALTIKKVYHFGDCGQEGELIQRILINLVNFSPETKFYRPWYSEVTPKALVRAFTEAKLLSDSKFVDLYEASKSRQITDYLMGLNYSYLTKSPIGRVKTPIIRAVYNRCKENLEHKKVPIYYLEAITKLLQYEVKLKSENFEEKIFDNVKTPQTLPIEYNIEEITKYPPSLHNLNSLQIRKLFSPLKTLEIAQKLYEKGLITYPRTETSKLSPNDDIEVFSKIFQHYANNKEIFELDKKNKKIFIDLEKEKTPDHTAIIPTEKSIDKESEKLPTDEKIIFMEILERFLLNFSKPAKARKISCKIKVVAGGKNYELKKTLEAIYYLGYLSNKINKNNKEEEKDKPMAISIDDVNKIAKIKESNFVLEQITDYTKPAPLFTESSMIKWLEKDCRKEVNKESKKDLPAGIGTVATRATILNQCVEKKYIEILKGKLVITDKGKEYCENLIKLDCERISKPELTAMMENALSKIREGANSNDYLEKVKQEISNFCKKLKSNYQATTGAKQTELKCPICKELLLKIKKGIFCEKKEFFIPSVFCGASLDKYFSLLIEGKETPVLELISKKGKNFSAGLKLVDNQISFVDSSKNTNKPCPICQTNLVEYDKYIACKNCGITLSKIFARTNIEAHHSSLIEGQKIKLEFTSNKNKPFTANILYSKEEKKLKLEFS